MQSSRLAGDGGARMRRRHIRRRREGGAPGRPSAGFAIPAMALGAIAMAVLSCGDGTVEPAPPPPAVATTVTISPGSAALSALGETARFTAEVRDRNGQVMAGPAVAWASSDASVASVDAAGLVTAAANGSATITATAGSVSGTAAVTVEQSVASVEVSMPVQTLLLGSSLQLDAEAFDGNGHVVSGPHFTWESSDEAVATVDESGRVTGTGEGVATITATTGEAQGTAMVAVEENPDRAVLELLYGATRGEGWVNSENWLTDAPLQDWYGVEIDQSGRVTGLDLAENGLAGVVPPELGRLSNLQRLELRDNGLTGPIPPELGELGGLVELALDFNYLEEAIPPELGNLAELSSLYLDRNQLTGSIPPELSRASRLRVLFLSANRLTGPVPPELGQLSELRSLNLEENDLTGPIPVELGGLSQLGRLRLSDNDLTGSIPSVLGDLANLGTLQLESNQLTGPIPPELGSLTRLELLWLGGNALTGPIPPELGNLTSLVGLHLSRNQLSGPLSPELGNLVSLEYAQLNGNELTGGLPRSFLGLNKLESFTIEYGSSTNRGLCIPSTDEFREWARQVQARGAVDRLPSPFCGEIDRRALEALHEAANGGRWTRSQGWLMGEDLARWHGVTTDSIGRVSGLDLSGNGLTGYVPEALGLLANMTELRIRDNELSGRLPLSLADLPLDELDYGGTSLCVADDADFESWLAGITVHRGTGVQCPPLSERDILELLYRNTGGSDWNERGGWLTDAPLSEWHGVEADITGRVIGLHLGRNGLAGSIPAELGQLPELRTLYLRGNTLSGPIPPELGDLSHLDRLDLSRNRLNGEIPAELGKLSRLSSLDLWGNRLSGALPPELGDLSRLERLEVSWNQLGGEIPGRLGQLGQLRFLWLHDNRLTGSIPSELGELSRLERLDLSGNQLSGEIPGRLSQLGQLRSLRLYDNGLTGSIPSGVGGLARLVRLDLGSNQLTGAIPGELGRLGALQTIALDDNGLTGSIPGAFGGLADLRELRLAGNDLGGSVPAELGTLSRLVVLDLGGNRLSGALPSDLGTAATLEELDLRSNELSGPVPPEFGALTQLKSLILANNPDLAGPLPPDITTLGLLDRFMAGGTGLCRPAETVFDTWFSAIADRRLVRCEGGAAAYLTQSVQSWDDPVPLLAGEPSLLRVFVTAPNAGAATMPDVRATFFVDGTARHTVHIPASSQAIPREVTEGNLAVSANAEIPGWLIEPGLEMVIEIDPEGTLDAELGVTKRIPEEGRMAVDVRAVPPFELTLIPFVHESDADSSVVGSVTGMARDPEGHELLRDVRTLLPISELAAAAHEPVITTTKNPRTMLSQVEAIRLMEGGTGHWMGVFPKSNQRGSINWPSGVARIGGTASMSEPIAGTIAHELGHNLGLLHAPCACGGTDPWFPHPGGRIGAWGYDQEQTEVVAPSAADVMSYCRSGVYWISDFFFNKALNHRLANAEAATAATARRTRTLLVWGGRDEDGIPYLDPAFAVDAIPALPEGGGDYTVSGATADGTELFSFPFEMPASPDAVGDEASFVFALPLQVAWADNLASITLSGPGGLATLDESTDRPMAILRDPRTAQVRAFLSDPPPATQTAADAGGGGTEQGLVALFSRGIPGAEAWRR